MFMSLGLPEGNMPVLSEPSLRPIVDRAVKELEAKSLAVDDFLELDQAEWTVDQEVGKIFFKRSNGTRVTAPVQIIGTFSTVDQTWLWAWDHPSVEIPLRNSALVLLKYGREHKIPALVTRKVTCQESDCWEFTALACKLCDAQTAYRGIQGTTHVFMTIGRLTMSPG
jgi:hypothetical protein